MSIYEDRTDPDRPLTEREIKSLQRLLSDPFSLPPEFWTALKTRFEQDPPALTWDSIIGFGIASNRAVPVVPVLDLAVDISAANTDLPSPGTSWNNIWQVNPGGGSLRSIDSGPALEGTRITLKHGWVGSTTLKHNNISGTGRPLFLSGAADLVLSNSESIELVLLDTMWQDVGRVEETVPPPTGLKSVIIQRDTPQALTGGLSIITGETEVQDDWAGYTPATSHIVCVEAGRYLITFDLNLGGGTGSTALSGGEIQHLNSGLTFVRTVARSFSAVINGGVSISAVVEVAAGEAMLFLAVSGASGTVESWTGGFSAVKIA